MAEADDGPSTPGLVLLWTTDGPALDLFPLDRPLTIGRRGGGGEIQLRDDLVSRSHARVEPAPEGGAWVRDLGSRNGIWIDGEGRPEALLRDRARLRLGHSIFLFVDDLRAFAGGIERIEGALVGPGERPTWERITRLAALGNHLLIRGESGTGKELAARAYHRAHGPGERPFIAVNCATIPEGVAERLLFGTRKGAYSGANADAPGYVQAAHGGTLFLDEFGELELAVQAKLLRFLESGEALPLGATRPLTVDVRVCLATNRDLREGIQRGSFREDLYYRVAEPSIVLPPLRERPASIPWLIQDVLDTLGGARRAHALLIEAALLRPWPGNVRELRRAIRSAAAEAEIAGHPVVMAADLGADAGAALGAPTTPTTTPAPASAAPPGAAPLDPPERLEGRSLRELDDATIRAALDRCGGNVSRAARHLGVHRNQIRRWLSKREGALEPCE
ncbi:MAG: sigma 54-interacting transcriptional regulator [Myxococcales bacterium]|nr:sigma 54-interacting transcriptional regulator [Myxococcales bacterium]MCB9706979.1 sigma 54-interacting transcriptional regulator [Myxococcales bacterium]